MSEGLTHRLNCRPRCSSASSSPSCPSSSSGCRATTSMRTETGSKCPVSCDPWWWVDDTAGSNKPDPPCTQIPRSSFIAKRNHSQFKISARPRGTCTSRSSTTRPSHWHSTPCSYSTLRRGTSWSRSTRSWSSSPSSRSSSSPFGKVRDDQLITHDSRPNSDHASIASYLAILTARQSNFRRDPRHLGECGLHHTHLQRGELQEDWDIVSRRSRSGIPELSHLHRGENCRQWHFYSALDELPGINDLLCVA